MRLKNTSGARTSILRLSPPNICHVITCSVHSTQTKGITFRKTTSIHRGARLHWDFTFFFLATHIVRARRRILGHCRTAGLSLQKLSLLTGGDEHLLRIAASSLSREGKPTLIPHRRASSTSLLDQRSTPLREEKICYKKWLMEKCAHERVVNRNILHVAHALYILFRCSRNEFSIRNKRFILVCCCRYK